MTTPISNGPEADADSIISWLNREEESDLPEDLSPILDKFLYQVRPHFHQQTLQELNHLAPAIAAATCQDCEEQRLDALVHGTLTIALPSALQHAVSPGAYEHASNLALLVAQDRWPYVEVRNRHTEMVINSTRIVKVASRQEDAQLDAELLGGIAQKMLNACSHR